ncbi:metallophosphoesterase family protein [Novosphingobium cyanobacteriorum]|uniref:Metallophosphoesterase n=1 Tax=Novosphingobium cyanobacteriorum TaxID=3024215 RepID=A0ABT6CJ50_9SPHN|nr:metallophosphoesterase [Novosphingobium cyanobacteriorum]MDF8333559.1 metallophosphoesterase [Novosphingobium cyanobacteriorum]
MTRIFHISDLHFGLEDRHALAWVADCIARERPDAVAITGDLTMRARHREFAAACDWIRALDVPVTVEVGNHDLPYFNLAERFLDPYRRFRTIEGLVEREIDLPGLAIVSLRTTARAQWRINWSKGTVSSRALGHTLAAIDALPTNTRALVACHHPLVEAGTRGKALTRGGSRALAELARRNVAAVLSGHVHDAFDLVHDTPNGPVRMIGAGTLSLRTRTTPPSFNELAIGPDGIAVKVRNLQHVPTPAMQVPEVPEDATPPTDPGQPVAAAAQMSPH